MVKYRDGGAERVLEALDAPVRRKIVARLARGGAMSVSKLAGPLHISLPATLKQVRILEDSGIIETHKRGRVRFCVLNKHAFKHLIGWLSSQTAFWQGSFDRLERHLPKQAGITKIKKH